MGSILDAVILHLLILTILTQLCQLSTAHVIPVESIKNTENNESQRRIPLELFNSLSELARIVDVSYCVGTTGVQKPFQCLNHCSELKGFELITTWNTGPLLSDSCGYIALSHPPSAKRIIVAFRGTYSITNAIIDLSVYPQEYVPYNTGKDDDDENSPKCTNCSVHAGFMSAWRATRPKILQTVAELRAEYPDYTLELVGHSLGGAVAALAGTEMQLRGWEPVVTTFGEPKVGNKGFVEFVGETFHLNGRGSTRAVVDTEDGRASQWSFRRVTHVNDPVPLLPLREWGYETHGGEIFISRVDLPFSVEDVVFCEGRRDQRCISGADTTAYPLFGGIIDPPVVRQQVLGDQSFPSKEEKKKTDEPASASALTSRLPWDLIPSRYRLWELLFAHRDYFLRMGLCVPGGDPTGRW